MKRIVIFRASFIVMISFLFIVSCTFEEIPILNGTMGSVNACIDLDKTSCVTPCIITTTNCSEGADSYLWDFGNGDTSTEESPIINYTTPNFYTIKLIASNLQNADTTEIEVTVTDQSGWICGQDITDTRNGRVYKTVQLGSQCWLAANLNADFAGLCYDFESSCDSLGRLYTYEESISGSSLCPEGWIIPDKSEWDLLISFLGGAELAGTKLKTMETWFPPNSGANDEYGFSAFAAGYFDPDEPIFFKNKGFVTGYLSSSENGPSHIWTYVLRNDSEAIEIISDGSLAKKTNGWSCRCVKN